ncbi:hypothetical protein EO98_09100 [Methanosarcina sp. 2.H.T.1A.6]|uniref:DUF262 domain-containing protein n=1 Tax=unclassified Methanosarcina TaxID=2644672 RepID=UPI000620EA26|nr:MULTISPECIES: DUF262 domain-containing protein [unclassified Methanosarcina]KKG14124.1 hypothetical protein EO94_15490 [Methanosarcina sp. 2.H.T.1A.3]KKG15380.1 hypothetical protein EO97_17865 [Methanosarcina sp. 2.H.T.1A.15]KKG19614.1 hypothetical protein EO98_09100 [Methanosarcina sp. 2.H.T.1A.6]KKG26766.1 hypothetical protein EO96_02365 [Methanosarcina sp. 2.H.T.1A.8]
MDEDEEIESINDEDTKILKKYQDDQKRLVSQKMDLYIPSLKDMINNGVIDLDPTFQRRDRWSIAQQSRLIESLIMAVPIPPVFLAEEEYNSYSVMDGKQRLTAIYMYLTDQFALTGLEFWQELNKKKFSELNKTVRSGIDRRYISAVVLLNESDLEIKFDVFERINTGGQNLTSQEVRNCMYRGRFNDLLIELSENENFKKCLGLPDDLNKLKKIKIYQRMDDIQLVLRFFLFQNYEINITGNLKTSMNDYMKERKTDSVEHKELAVYRTLFTETIDKVYKVYGNIAFRKWDLSKNDWGTISAPLYDAVMYNFSKVSPDSIIGNEERITNGTKLLFEDNEFVESIRKGTNGLEANKIRIQKFMEMLKSSME